MRPCKDHCQKSRNRPSRAAMCFAKANTRRDCLRQCFTLMFAFSKLGPPFGRASSSKRLMLHRRKSIMAQSMKRIAPMMKRRYKSRRSDPSCGHYQIRQLLLEKPGIKPHKSAIKPHKPIAKAPHKLVIKPHKPVIEAFHKPVIKPHHA